MRSSSIKSSSPCKQIKSANSIFPFFNASAEVEAEEVVVRNKTDCKEESEKEKEDEQDGKNIMLLFCLFKVQYIKQVVSGLCKDGNTSSRTTTEVKHSELN